MAIAEIPFQAPLTLNRDTMWLPFSISRITGLPVSLRRTIASNHPDLARMLDLNAFPIIRNSVYPIEELSERQGRRLVLARLWAYKLDPNFSEHVLPWGPRDEQVLANGQSVETAQRKYGLGDQLREVRKRTITGRQMVEYYREELGKMEAAAKLGTFKLEELR